MRVESTPAARARGFELSPTTFRRLALGSAGWLWLIVVSGATVRLTASGLGCEHWPGCTAGNPFPSKSYHSFIEFGNRIVSALTILATLVGWAGARLTPGVPRWTRRLALGTFLGTLAQAPLGAITVYADLNPWLVMSHFLLALTVLAAGVVVAVEAVSFERGRAHTRLPQTIRRRAFVAPACGRVRPCPRNCDLRRPLHCLPCLRPSPSFALAVVRGERRRAALPAPPADGHRRAAVPNTPSLVARADPRRSGCSRLGMRGCAGHGDRTAAEAVRAACDRLNCGGG